MLLSSLVCFICYGARNRFSSKALNKGNEGVVISLTTYGERINSVYLTIESLFNQKQPVNKIYLWLSRQDTSEGSLPRTLLRLQARGLTIKFVDENLYSYKKLIYTYEIEKTEVEYIATADDDVYYPRKWLEKLLLVSKREKNKAVLCYRGKIIQFKAGKLDDYSDWPTADNTDNDKNKIMPTGVSGVLYPINSLKDVNQKNIFLDGFKTADDIWFKFITLKNGFQSRLITQNSVHFPPVISSINGPLKGLEVINVEGGMNTKIFNHGISLFKLDSIDFD